MASLGYRWQPLWGLSWGHSGQTVEGLRRESFTGEALRECDAAEALRVLNAGLKSLGMGRDEVRRLRKNPPPYSDFSFSIGIDPAYSSSRQKGTREKINTVRLN